MRTKTVTGDTAEIVCLANGKKLVAEVLDFRPSYSLTVSVDRKARIHMRYNTGKKLYIGNVGSLEFTSTGPNVILKYEGRR